MLFKKQDLLFMATGNMFSITYCVISKPSQLHWPTDFTAILPFEHACGDSGKKNSLLTGRNLGTPGSVSVATYWGFAKTEKTHRKHRKYFIALSRRETGLNAERNSMFIIRKGQRLLYR
ncbi:hypothetical protein XENOCAPTIV_006340 [Xenoophorus captivus]|uniref:Uncharacterized protein n=1 Tax=Xenoophorus captivus TaxID=1517983 RepID=A0ABV0SFZ8_9TELE